MEDLFVNCFCLAALTRPPSTTSVVGRETNFLMNISWFSFSFLVCERAFLVDTKNWAASCAMDGRHNVDSAVTVLPTIWLANLSRHGVRKSSCRALRVTHVLFLTNYQEFRSYFSPRFFSSFLLLCDLHEMIICMRRHHKFSRAHENFSLCYCLPTCHQSSNKKFTLVCSHSTGSSDAPHTASS